VTTTTVFPIVLALSVPLFGGCSAKNQAPPHAVDQNWAILNRNDLTHGAPFPGCETWEPSDSNVPRIIHKAQLYLKELREKTRSDFQREEIPKILAQWDQYACQVVGYQKNGKRLIHFSFLPKRGTTEKGGLGSWRHRYYTVFDGGADFWQIEYDDEQDRFFDFTSNGYA
jgi:hypothetical protein